MSEQQVDIYSYAVSKGVDFKTARSGIEWASKNGCPNPDCSSRDDGFSVQPEGKHTGLWAGYGAWKCRKCWDPSEMVTVEHGPEQGTRRKRGWGSIIDLVMRCEGITYSEAYRFVTGYRGDVVPMKARPALQKPKSDEVWFKETYEYLLNSQRVGQAEKDMVQQCLASRGLTVETAKRLGLGYSLDKVKINDEWREIPFLVIPWYMDKEQNTLYRVVNRRNLRNPLPKDEPKYKLRWQSNRDALYLGETLVTHKRPTFIVESELDAATILQEAGDLVNVVATGSTGGGRNAFNEMRLRRQPFVFVSFDVDASGEEASDHWLSKLERLKSIRYRPLLHDVNEMHTQGYSVRSWVVAALTHFVPGYQQEYIEREPVIVTPAAAPVPTPVQPGRTFFLGVSHLKYADARDLTPDEVLQIAHTLTTMGVTFTAPLHEGVNIRARFPLPDMSELTERAVRLFVLKYEAVLLPWVLESPRVGVEQAMPVQARPQPLQGNSRVVEQVIAMFRGPAQAIKSQETHTIKPEPAVQLPQIEEQSREPTDIEQEIIRRRKPDNLCIGDMCTCGCRIRYATGECAYCHASSLWSDHTMTLLRRSRSESRSQRKALVCA